MFQRELSGSATERLVWMRTATSPLVNRIRSHQLYDTLSSLDAVRVFAEGHVFAVWDFMSILKRLQSTFTCVETPWVPVGDRVARRLVNEIVLAEESDEVAYLTYMHNSGEYLSHFELYIEAMRQLGANAAPIEGLVERIRHGASIHDALATPDIHPECRAFVSSTFELLSADSAIPAAAAFAVGREQLIPHMFRSTVVALRAKFPNEITLLCDYLVRHIGMDDDEHSEAAFYVLASLCGDDDHKWDHALEAARTALTARAALWDGLHHRVSEVASRELAAT